MANTNTININGKPQMKILITADLDSKSIDDRNEEFKCVGYRKVQAKLHALVPEANKMSKSDDTDKKECICCYQPQLKSKSYVSREDGDKECKCGGAAVFQKRENKDGCKCGCECSDAKLAGPAPDEICCLPPAKDQFLLPCEPVKKPKEKKIDCCCAEIAANKVEKTEVCTQTKDTQMISAAELMVLSKGKRVKGFPRESQCKMNDRESNQRCCGCCGKKNKKKKKKKKKKRKCKHAGEENKNCCVCGRHQHECHERGRCVIM